MKNTFIILLVAGLMLLGYEGNALRVERDLQVVKTAEALDYADQWRGIAFKYQSDNNDLNKELDSLESDKLTDTLLGRKSLF